MAKLSIANTICKQYQIPEEDMRRFHENRNRICKRYGITTKEYNLLCSLETQLHRWYEAECNGFIQRDEPTNIPWEYTADQYDSPIVRSIQPLPDFESKAIEMAKSITRKYGLDIYIQTDPRGCALHLYQRKDCNGRQIDECYSTCTEAISFRC